MQILFKKIAWFRSLSHSVVNKGINKLVIYVGREKCEIWADDLGSNIYFAG